MTIFTSKELFRHHAPDFNFELDEAQLLAKALKVGFVTKIEDDQYQINETYPDSPGPNFIGVHRK